MIVTLKCSEGETTPKFDFDAEATPYHYVSTKWMCVWLLLHTSTNVLW